MSKKDIVITLRRKDVKRLIKEIDEEGTMMPLFEAGALALSEARDVLERERNE